MLNFCRHDLWLSARNLRINLDMASPRKENLTVVKSNTETFSQRNSPLFDKTLVLNESLIQKVRKYVSSQRIWQCPDSIKLHSQVKIESWAMSFSILSQNLGFKVDQNFVYVRTIERGIRFEELIFDLIYRQGGYRLRRFVSQINPKSRVKVD